MTRRSGTFQSVSRRSQDRDSTLAPAMQRETIMQSHTSAFDAARPNRAGYRDVSIDAVREVRGKVRLVDVREPHELVSEGFVAGAEHVPLATVEAAASNWNKDDEIILICRSGNRSGRAAEQLVRRGFHRVMNMTGGILAWAAAGYPIARM